jgi:hypothetical protein
VGTNTNDDVQVQVQPIVRTIQIGSLQVPVEPVHGGCRISKCTLISTAATCARGAAR